MDYYAKILLLHTNRYKKGLCVLKQRPLCICLDQANFNGWFTFSGNNAISNTSRMSRT